MKNTKSVHFFYIQVSDNSILTKKLLTIVSKQRNTFKFIICKRVAFFEEISRRTDNLISPKHLIISIEGENQYTKSQNPKFRYRVLHLLCVQKVVSHFM